MRSFGLGRSWEWFWRWRRLGICGLSRVCTGEQLRSLGFIRCRCCARSRASSEIIGCTLDLLLSRGGDFGWFVACKIAWITRFGPKERIGSLWCNHWSFPRQQARENERHGLGQGQNWIEVRLGKASLSFTCPIKKTVFVKKNNHTDRSHKLYMMREASGWACLHCAKHA